MNPGISTAGRWERLGALLIQRRTQISPRFHNRGAFCEATGLNYRLVYDIEEARRTNFGGPVLAAIEAAYRLAPGAVGRFLDGGSDREILPAPAAALSGSGTLVAAPPRPAAVPRRDVDFAGGNPEALRPWRQQVLHQLYSALGLLDRLGPGELPGPAELPGIDDARSVVPGSVIFSEDREAGTWDDPALSVGEAVDVIAATRMIIAGVDEREGRRTGLGHYPVTAGIAFPVSVGRRVLGASS